MHSKAKAVITHLLRWGIAVGILLPVLLCAQLKVSAMEQEGDTPPAEGDAAMEADVDPWHTHTMLPGETYNVGTASKNTTVYIDSEGNYYLKGESTYCRVVIRSGGVNLYLKDGLVIDPGIYAYVGSSTAAITVEDQGGTVRLISERNAQIYFGGYYYAPAIRKDGHNTRLVFETEDPASPGTVTAYRSAASQSAGIGSVYRLIADNSYTGNMEFKSGNIIATGGTNAAGIGCGSGANKCVDLLFSGANVTATGLGYGAGIGGGLSGAADKIKITGGTVVANGELGAGIGGGKTTNTYDGRCGTITVAGGDVTATSQYASGIGNGIEGNIKHIIITGGTVRAVCKNHSGTGIGGTGSNYYGRCEQIDISGGTVYAQGGPDNGVGIGSALTGEGGNTTINISGGYIEAIAGNKGVSIGGGGRGALQDKGHCYVNISGGTVLCGPIFGARIGSDYSSTCTITGGSVRCAKVDCNVTDQPNGAGNMLTMMNINLMGCPGRTRVTEATYIGAGVDYGMKDVYTADGDAAYTVVYPWLPMESSTLEMTAGTVHFYGNVETSQGEGELYPATKIILDRNAGSSEPSAMNGEAAGVLGEISARDVTHAKRPGYTLKAYAADAAGKTPVMRTDGSFLPDCSGFTDNEGKWLIKAGSATLYAVWESNRFTVRFDGNAPKGASTVVSGSMADQGFVYGTAQNLTENAFTLTGYTFKGWNTAQDGSGTSLPDRADGSKLCQTKDGTLTLYAQWSPITYTVKFLPNGGSGSMTDQTFTFDLAQKLTACSFTKEGKLFSGWETTGETGFLFRDGQTVENLAHTQDEVVELGAVWMDHAKLLFSVTLDDAPQKGCVFTLVSPEGTAFDVPFTPDERGIYVFDGAGLPDGDYQVFINSCDTGRTVTNPSAATEHFAYYSVNVSAGEHIHTVTLQETNSSGAVTFGDKEAYPAGAGFLLTAKDFDSGYAFDSWQSPGTDPVFIEGKTAKDNPTAVRITGKTELLAQARGVGYAVRFDTNVPQGASTAVTGQMEDQLFIYGKAQSLVPCGYALTGYTFQGWNDREDGAGTGYADGEEVINLTASEDATVILFAQWTPVTYRVVFNGNRGTGMMPSQQLTFDTPAKLMKNQFGLADWHFTGWAYEDTLLADEAEVVNLASEKDARVVLYAQWGQDSYTVIYDPNGASGNPMETLAYCHQTGYIAACGFKRKTHTFAGWTLDKEGKGTVYLPGDAFTDLAEAGETVTLYARWKAGPPRTGDTHMPLLWAAMALASGGGLFVLYRRRRKHR